MIKPAWLEPMQVLALDLSLESAEAIAERLIMHNRPITAADLSLRHQLEARLHSEKRYAQLHELLAAVMQSGVNTAHVGHALLAAAHMSDTLRRRKQVSLLWTGPETHEFPIRRNDQGLLEVIRSARATLYIVTFALYPVKAVQKALHEALARGVQVHFFIEFPQQDNSLNKVNVNTIKSIGLEAALRCHIYEWPMAKRHQSTYKGQPSYATLHAKIAAADDRLLFLSSANLTSHAMQHNMEMGILIHNGEEPRRVRRHLQGLVEQGDFVRKSEDEIVMAAGW